MTTTYSISITKWAFDYLLKYSLFYQLDTLQLPTTNMKEMTTFATIPSSITNQIEYLLRADYLSGVNYPFKID